MNPEDFSSIQEVISWFLYPSSFSSLLEGYPLKLSVSYQQENIFICDLRIKVRGFEEDKIFTNNSKIRVNIRRGNSLLLILKPGFEIDFLSQVQSEKPKNSSLRLEHFLQATWVRRGLMKFFDISLTHLEAFHSSVLKNCSRPNSSESHKIIFKPVEKAFEIGRSVEVYQTEKANGENVQISYCRLVDKWIISSKNCSVVVKHLEELNNFTEARYDYAKKIAETWFGILHQISDLPEFIHWIEGKTMIGEYIGNQECQHIVKYEKEEIRFYAVCENNSAFSSIPILESFYYLQRFQIKTVSIKKIGRFFNLNELSASLISTFHDISREDLKTGGEGSVLYLCSNSFQDFGLLDLIENKVLSGQIERTDEALVLSIKENQQVLSLGKIKTVDYRLYRKIREKIKNLTNDPKVQASKKELFFKECTEICENFGLYEKIPFFLEYYEKISKRVMEKLKEPGEKTKKNKIKEDLNLLINTSVPPIFLETSWIVNIDVKDFQKLPGLTLIPSNRNLKEFESGCLYHNCFNENTFNLETASVYFIGFTPEEEEKFLEKSRNFNKPSDFPPDLLKFSRKQDLVHMEGKIRSTFESQRNLASSLKPEFNSTFSSFTSSDQVLTLIAKDFGLTLKQSKSEIKLRLILILPITIPGTGKTFIRRHIQNVFKQTKDCNYKQIDCDEIRLAIINKNPKNLSFSEKFQESSEVLLEKTCESILETMKRPQNPGVFYIDKNFSHHSISQVKNFFESLGHRVTLIGLIPESYPSGFVKDTFFFSLTFLAACLKRVLLRKGHKLMNQNENLSKIQILFETYKKMTQFSVMSCEKILNQVLKVRFLDENLQYLSPSVQSVLLQVLKKQKIDEEDLKSVEEVLAEFNLEESDFGQETSEQVKSVLERFGVRFKSSS